MLSIQCETKRNTKDKHTSLLVYTFHLASPHHRERKKEEKVDENKKFSVHIQIEG